MISSEDASKIIMNTIKKLPATQIGLDSALGYVLAEDLASQVDVPLFDNSAMDGFAIHKSDLETDKPLNIVDEIAAGQGQSKAIKKGEAMSIMTGGVIPKGTSAVVPVENTIENTGQVKIVKAVKKGENIRRTGEDIKKAATLIKEGTPLKPIHIALAASTGNASLKVYGKPRLALVVTGNEIIKPGNRLKPGQIYDSNSHLIKSLLNKLGIELVFEKNAQDSLSQTVKVFKEAFTKADILLTTGGISVGKFDFVAAALQKIGAKCHFDSVRQKPGKPLSFFTFKDKSVVCLPGNPVAVAVCFELYVRPILLKQSGNHNFYHQEINARLATGYKKKKGRKNWVRVNLQKKDGLVTAIPTGAQGSGILTSMLADGIAVLGENKQEFKPGDSVKVIDLEGVYT